MQARKEVCVSGVSPELLDHALESGREARKGIMWALVLLIFLIVTGFALAFAPGMERPGILYEGVGKDGAPYCYARVVRDGPIVPCARVDEATLLRLRAVSIPQTPGFALDVTSAPAP